MVWTEETREAERIVALDDACRRQQVGEGWFASIADVPSHAVSMSVHQILASREIIAVVPDARKAEAVRACFEGDISPMAPASILRRHANTVVYLALLRIVAAEPDLVVDDPNAEVIELPPLKETLLAGLHYLLPVVLLIWAAAS